MRRGLPKEMSLDSPAFRCSSLPEQSQQVLKWATQTSCRHWNFQLFFRLGPLGLHCIVLTRYKCVGQVGWRNPVVRCCSSRYFAATDHVFFAETNTNFLGNFAVVGACEHMFQGLGIRSDSIEPQNASPACEPRSSRQHWMWWTWRLEGLNWKGTKKWRGTCNFKSFP